jgi:hypothetical protein
MTTQSLRSICAISAAVLLPAIVWRCAQALDPGGFVPMPFGDLRLVVAQAIAVLPLAWIVAGWIKPLPRWAWLAAMVALACWMAGPWWTTRLETVSNDATVDYYFRELLSREDRFVFLHFLRVSVLLVPAIALCYAAGVADVQPRRKVLAALLCVAIAAVPTYFYARTRAAAHRALARQLSAEGRIWKAWQANAAALAIDRSTSEEARELFVLDRWLSDRLRRANQFASAVEPEDRLRALPHLLALEENDRAKAIIAEMPAELRDEVRPFRIELARREERWNDVIALLEPQAQEEYDLLAAAYRGQGNPAAAERLYLRLIDERPDEERHWKLQLAKHYDISGRPMKAAALYAAVAAESHDEMKAEATLALERLQMRTPTCLLRW